MRVRAVMNDQGQTQLLAHPQQGSGVLSSAAWADGFAMVEAGETVMLGQALLFTAVKCNRAIMK